MGKRRWSIEEREQIVKDYRSGMSLRAVAAKYKTGHMSISNIVTKAGAMRDKSGIYPKKHENPPLAQLVKAVRTDLGLSQVKLAERLGVVRSQISNIEAGNSDMPASKLLSILDEAGWKIVSPNS